MKEIKVRTSSKDGMHDITAKVKALIPSSMKSGICVIFCEHTTAAVTINENADPDVKTDILNNLNRLIPFVQPEFLHREGNSAAHLKSSLIGCSLTIPVQNGYLALGCWQGIYLCEFDGPRDRQVSVTLVNS
ncbi:MAG: secondary thiamine-phosphate synthase enzyme YjbQ [Victivallaceae bacterium]|jgi:secondary thiamine-phosphate synthase enzyme|nr:secondary thiamine-phosphate synthase enzyme YjbQ [Victivallaceae bacterium]NLK83522.1 YjbQ family protein [Lentisphaerota bacterium]MDD3115779.1 secondary thiamine-phosphate synthase enzyme YjbQ [Victivallaceae bacterium]MDD3703400.1 secondary thiamine-phosphate synthase enzyme YjbQ [Victivallaceae bacterium]MDD4316961.1 secondary thiamine-phosphate synthase enzyme YjbQ [Victivallaceae bacterium]